MSIKCSKFRNDGRDSKTVQEESPPAAAKQDASLASPPPTAAELQDLKLGLSLIEHTYITFGHRQKLHLALGKVERMRQKRTERSCLGLSLLQYERPALGLEPMTPSEKCLKSQTDFEDDLRTIYWSDVDLELYPSIGTPIAHVSSEESLQQIKLQQLQEKLLKLKLKSTTTIRDTFEMKSSDINVNWQVPPTPPTTPAKPRPDQDLTLEEFNEVSTICPFTKIFKPNADIFRKMPTTAEPKKNLHQLPSQTQMKPQMKSLMKSEMASGLESQRRTQLEAQLEPQLKTKPPSDMKRNWRPQSPKDSMRQLPPVSSFETVDKLIINHVPCRQESQDDPQVRPIIIRSLTFIISPRQHD